MDQISISTIFKRHLVLCRAITNNDYSKLREEQFPQKELNVAVALILGQNKIFHPISYKITNMRVPYIFYLFRDYMLDSCLLFLTLSLNQFPTHKRLSPKVNSDSILSLFCSNRRPRTLSCTFSNHVFVCSNRISIA
jgi:hypothetical protein